jgi:hypothetical protein
MESLQIPKRLMQTLRRRAEELGVTPEEFLIELMVDAVDPGERSQAYIDAAREMLEQAKKELGSGDLKQVSKKIWGAATLAVKAHAYARERRRLASHAELWQHKSMIAEELGVGLTTLGTQLTRCTSTSMKDGRMRDPSSGP